MAQFSPIADGLQIITATTPYDRSAVFPLLVSQITINSVDLYLGAGWYARVAVYESSSPSSTTGMTLIHDFGLQQNTGALGFFTYSAPGGKTVAAGKYAVVVVRYDTDMYAVGNGGYPFGDVIYASRSNNENAGSGTAFANPSIADEGVDASLRIPYARLNYTAAPASATASGTGVETGADTAAGSASTVNRGLRTPTIYEPNSDSVIANATSVRAVVRDAIGGAENLDIANAVIASGICTIDNDSVGALGATVDLELRWTASGETRFVSTQLTVINLDL